jgi:hypothetical protein
MRWNAVWVVVCVLLAGCPSSGNDTGDAAQPDLSPVDMIDNDVLIADSSDAKAQPSDGLQEQIGYDGLKELDEHSCDAIVQVDFPCSKKKACESFFFLRLQKTFPCSHYYPDGCCEGADCQKVGVEPCPEGTHCEVMEGKNDECVLDGECVPCKPDCGGRECGDDGCGGSCGACANSGFCLDEMGMCGFVDPPNCQGRHCGPDGMGGSCGICDGGFHCFEGACTPFGGGCEGIPTTGLCMNGWAITCVAGAPKHSKCKFGGCVAEEGKASCLDVPCVPNCFGKQCGDDGCGSSCGICGEGENCNELAVCEPEQVCGDYGEGSHCLGHVAATCNAFTGKWYSQSCLELGQVCGVTACDQVPSCRPVWPDTFSCDSLPDGGTCIEGSRYYCDEGFLAVEHCVALGYPKCERTDFDKFECAF